MTRETVNDVNIALICKYNYSLLISNPYIDDENRNIRFNSIVMLGKWFLSYDSKEQLINQYWKETDSQIKLLILSSLEMLITNLSESKEFFNSVIQNESDPKARDFAQESLCTHRIEL